MSDTKTKMTAAAAGVSLVMAAVVGLSVGVSAADPVILLQTVHLSLQSLVLPRLRQRLGGDDSAPFCLNYPYTSSSAVTAKELHGRFQDDLSTLSNLLADFKSAEAFERQHPDSSSTLVSHQLVFFMTTAHKSLVALLRQRSPSAKGTAPLGMKLQGVPIVATATLPPTSKLAPVLPPPPPIPTEAPTEAPSCGAVGSRVAQYEAVLRTTIAAHYALRHAVQLHNLLQQLQTPSA